MFTENQFGLDRLPSDEEPAYAEPERRASGNASDRRRHARYTVDGEAEVLLADGSQIFRGGVIDISLSGCFIETKARLRMAVGTPVEMVFRANGVMLRMSATVRALRPGVGAGFLFETPSIHMQDELQVLIEALDLTKPNARCLVIPPGKRSG